jgi:hypothetical protein
MSAADKATEVVDKATEVVVDAAADAAAEVAQHAEQMETLIRSMSRTKLKYGLLGVVIGSAVGTTVTFALVYRRAQTKFSKIADDEIADMRLHYQEKIKAAEATAQKLAPIKEIVVERGYAQPDESPDEPTDEPPPMVIKPPIVERQEKRSPPPEPETRNVFEEAEITHEWDWHEERKNRSPDIPYVIHYDERHEMDYQDVTLTYYDGDDVLCDDRDVVIDPNRRNELLGDQWMNRFGHGSGDASIVFIRNDQLEIMYEVVKSPHSFAEEVHGFTHDDAYRGNLERMRARERDEQED